ncbi:MAG: hypothetical protein JXC85_00455 [Candidatus Aenigmarchaeota archaeon]|nr:hypothetical protein [Candidatus Aenigmarchaeota archaeon]
MFNPLSLIFGWGYRIRRLRKRWDRLREKTLKKDASVRSRLLQREDQIEQNLRILEERRLNRRERARLAKELEIDLAEIKAMLGASPEELQAAAAGRAQPTASTQKAKEEEQQSY